MAERSAEMISEESLKEEIFVFKYVAHDWSYQPGMGIDLVYCFSLSFCHHRSSNKEDAAFDEIIGHIQDILLGVKSRSSKLFFFRVFFIY